MDLLVSSAHPMQRNLMLRVTVCEQIRIGRVCHCGTILFRHVEELNLLDRVMLSHISEAPEFYVSVSAGSCQGLSLRIEAHVRTVFVMC